MRATGRGFAVGLPAPGPSRDAGARFGRVLLDPHDPRGWHKARVFLPALNLGQGDADFLRRALLEAAREEDVAAGEADQCGARDTVDFLTAHGDREARVRSAWIILRGESAPRLTVTFCAARSARWSNNRPQVCMSRIQR